MSTGAIIPPGTGSGVQGFKGQVQEFKAGFWCRFWFENAPNRISTIEREPEPNQNQNQNQNRNRNPEPQNLTPEPPNPGTPEP